MNNLYGPLKDVRVRQALNYAVNKQAIIHSVLFGLAQRDGVAGCPGDLRVYPDPTGMAV
jgi:ABC-type transport system substrate-binding protein